MDLIDRYLAAVSALLPAAQRADIIAELRDLLLSRREEKAAELGRPLTRAEDAELLRGFGRPFIVAARYGAQGYLIGPELYPIYRFVLRMVLALVGVAAAVGAIIAFAVTFDIGDAIGTIFKVGINGAIGATGVLTLIFALLQRYDLGARIANDWNPEGLHAPAARRRRPRGQAERVAENLAGIVVNIIALLWWTHAVNLDIPYVTYAPMGAGQRLSFAPAPIWRELFWPVTALMLGAIVVHGLRLSAPGARLGAALDAARQAATGIVAYVALQANAWIVVLSVGLPTATAAKLSYAVNLGIHITLIVVICAAVGVALADLWSLTRPTPDKADQAV
jgi:hypothetical protein